MGQLVFIALKLNIILTGVIFFLFFIVIIDRATYFGSFLIHYVSPLEHAQATVLTVLIIMEITHLLNKYGCNLSIIHISKHNYILSIIMFMSHTIAYQLKHGVLCYSL